MSLKFMRPSAQWLAPTLLAAAAALTVAPAAAQTTYKMAYALSQQSHYGAAGNAFAKTLEEGGQGKHKVQQFPNSALGGEREVIEACNWAPSTWPCSPPARP